MGVYKKESTMFEILTLILFGWLVWKAFGLFFKITWGLAKIIATLLLIFAFPVPFVLPLLEALHCCSPSF